MSQLKYVIKRRGIINTEVKQRTRIEQIQVKKTTYILVAKQKANATQTPLDILDNLLSRKLLSNTQTVNCFLPEGEKYVS